MYGQPGTNQKGAQSKCTSVKVMSTNLKKAVKTN